MKRRTFLSTTTKAAVGASLLSSVQTHSETHSKWQIGIFTRPWAAHDYQVAFDEMVKAGYKYAGVMTSPKGLIVNVETSEKEAATVGANAKKRGLTILSVYGGQFYEDQSKQKAINGLKKLIDNIHACGSKSLLLGGTGSDKAFDNYYAAVKECCDFASERNVIMTLKPHGGLNATGAACRQTVEKINHPNFQLWYDPGNIFYYSDGSLDPLQDVDSVADIVKGMCVKDFEPPKNVALTPGTGLVDFPALFAKLQKANFTGGPLVIECLKDGDLVFLQQQAKKARLYLENILV